MGHSLSGTRPSVVVVPGCTCSTAGGIFPDHGSKSVSPALAGGFLSTVPPGKSQGCLYSGTLDTDPEAGIFVGGGGFRSGMTNRTEHEKKANYHDAFGLEIFLLLVSRGTLEGALHH